MSHSYKNTSQDGGETKGNTGAHYSKIASYSDPHPPSGESNSYEKVRKQIDGMDDKALAHKPYTREKMKNK